VLVEKASVCVVSHTHVAAPGLGAVRKLLNRLLREYNMDLQPAIHTICCGGDRC
jgi:hypothetical protein